MKEITKVSERPLDGRVPNMSISSASYQKGLAKLRKQAKEEKRKLITNKGVEDYTNYIPEKGPEEIEWVKKGTWEEFRKCGLLWWANRILHLFGWAIVYSYDENDDIKEVYPARVKYRGFDGDVEEKGHQNLTEYLKNNIADLSDETKL